ncbi:MAG: 4-oxalomesaconate tautomerase [Pseudomonadota bacterium]
MTKGIPCSWIRGGTSKGAYFVASDLPADDAERDRLLLAILGSPDPRQIDGIGGADPLTSKVAIVSPPSRADADVDFLFLQVFVDKPVVTDAQNCGNILAGVAQFAVERGLLTARDGTTVARVHMLNSAQVAEVEIQTPGARVTWSGDAQIDGVPGSAAPVLQNFPEAAGSNCGALLPTGNARDTVAGTDVTLIDNGMPVVVLRASDVGITGTETRDALDANDALKAVLERVRLAAGPLMNLGDVSEKSVPKMTLVSPAQHGGTVTSRTFIPHRCHASIGVLGAVSVATACVLEGSVCNGIAGEPDATGRVSVEHPIGEVSVVMATSVDAGELKVGKAAVLRTARKLFEGTVYPAN